MSHDRLLNMLRLHAGNMDQSGSAMKLGIVTDYDPVNIAARVQIQPEGVLSGWLPCGSLAVGATCIVVPPMPGDQVLLEPQEGDAEQLHITMRLFSANARAPSSPGTGQPVQSGEIALFHQSGTYIHLANDGNIHSAATVWMHTGNVSVTGAIFATEDITDLDGTHGTVGALRAAYDAHLHTGVQSGSSDTGTTTIPV